MSEVSIRGSDFSITGPPRVKYFTIRMLGDGLTGRMRVSKLLSLLRSADGTWKSFFVKAATGEQKVKLFLNRDKAMSQITRERAARLVYKILMDKGITGLYCLRSTGTISKSWTPLVKVELNEAGGPSLLWNEGLTASAGIDKAEVLEAFSCGFGSSSNAGPISWCV